MIDLSTLKTFEDAVDAFEKIDFENDPEADADANMVARWIWDNCDHDDKDAMREVWIWSHEDSELESLAYRTYYR
jgi:hypothetical protein